MTVVPSSTSVGSQDDCQGLANFPMKVVIETRQDSESTRS